MFIALQYSDISGLERSIDAAYHMASQRLFEVFIEKFKLLDHLRALKHYLMLGHGDFADQLMETLGCAQFPLHSHLDPCTSNAFAQAKPLTPSEYPL